MERTYIIAEIGINHNGDLNIAKRLIDIAQVAGCDAVKFQKREPDICVPEHQKGVMKKTPWGEMTYLEYKKKTEFGLREYTEISAYCRSRNIQWSASPWDIPSLRFLKEMDVPWIKIPSAHLTNIDLIKDAALWCYNFDKKIILSRGMSTLDEVDKAVAMVRKIMGSSKDLVVMHCNSSYPAPLEELNLQAIVTLKERYGCQIGYSGHEFRLGTSVAAVYLGATYIERHITIDRSMWGTDQLASVEPQGLMKLVSGIRELEKARGDGEIRVMPSEAEARKRLRG